MLAASDTLNTAADIAAWVRQELGAPNPDTDHIIRVMTRETSRWFHNGLDPEAIQALAQAPGSTGSPQWDALIEGITAYLLHIHNLSAPAWTKTTQLPEGWSPRDALIRDQRHYVMSVFETPAELLNKGVVFARSEMDLL
jgi:hypothetical protein